MLYPLPVPRSEALVMPTVVERATQSPRVYVCQAIGTPYYIYDKAYRRLVNTHPWTSIVAPFLTTVEIYQISERQEQASDKRQFHKVHSPHDCRPLRGLCITTTTTRGVNCGSWSQIY